MYPLPLKSIVVVGAVTALLLMAPLLAMQFSAEVLWSPSDFLFAGLLVFGTGTAIALIANRALPGVYRAAATIAVLGMALLMWTNLAVGMIGSEDNPANRLYAGVVIAAVLGCALARFEPRGMARTLFVMAAIPLAAPLIAAAAGMFPALPAVSLLAFAGGTAFFVLLFLTSGMLFQRSMKAG